MPSLDLFLEQSDDYKASVLGQNLPTLAVEMAHPDSWYKLLNKSDKVLGY